MRWLAALILLLAPALGVLGKSGKMPKQFRWIHEIACPSENELWVAEILNWRVQKLVLKPTSSTSRQ